MKLRKSYKHIGIAISAVVTIVIIAAIVIFFYLHPSNSIISGKVEFTEYRLSGDVSGVVEMLCVKEGDYVRVGDTLAIISVSDETTRFKRIETQMELDTLLVGTDKKDKQTKFIRGAFSLLQQAKMAHASAKKTYEQVRQLYIEGVVAEDNCNDAFVNYKILEAQQVAAQRQFDVLVGQYQHSLLSVNNGDSLGRVTAIDNDTYTIAHAQTALVAGEVSEIYTYQGETIAAGAPLLSIAKIEDVWGAFNVQKDQLERFNVDGEFEVLVPAFNKSIKMKVYSVKPLKGDATWDEADSETIFKSDSMYEVKAKPITQIDGLRPDMTLVLTDK